MLNEIVRLRENATQYLRKLYLEKKLSQEAKDHLTKYGKEARTHYQYKWNAIENSIYAVDIEPSAVDITKLRLWLSLVVEQELEDGEEPHTLPNLDCKIMSGNSLVDEYKGVKLFDSEMIHTLQSELKDYATEGNEMNDAIQITFQHDQKELQLRNLKEAKHKYYNATNSIEKEENKQKIADMRLGYLSQCFLGTSKEVWEQFMADDKKTKKDYFSWQLEFTEVFTENGGFDIVIGNPPYGANIDQYIELFRKKYPKVSKGFKDIYKYFFSLALDKILKNRGILSFITPNTYMLQPRYEDLRIVLLNNTIHTIINLGENVFEAVVPTAITIIINKEKNNNIILYSDVTEYSKYEGIKKIKFENIEQNKIRNINSKIITNKIREQKEDEILLNQILDMRDGGFKYQRVNVGLSEKGKNDLADRIFYKGSLQEESDIPIYIGKDIEQQGYVIKVKEQKYLRHDYKSILRDNEKTYYNKQLLESDVKIIWRQTAPYFIGCILEDKAWFCNTIQGGTIKEKYKEIVHPKYLLALLNSKYLRFIYSQNVKENGRVFPQVKLEKLRSLPVKIIDIKEQFKFCKLVEEMAQYIDNGSTTKLKETEAKINSMVYDLYDINENDKIEIEKLFN